MFFGCLLSDGLFQIMCASFKLNRNGEEVKSIISKEFSGVNTLQVSSLTRCAKMCDFLFIYNS